MSEAINDSNASQAEVCAQLSTSAEVRVDEELFLRRLLTRYFSGPKPSSNGPAPIIRVRPPYSQTSVHDARGDAVMLVFEHLQQKEFPIWAAYICAYEFVEVYKEKLQTALVKFDPDVYEPIDATKWCREVLLLLNEFMTEMSNNERPLPTKPEHWDHFPFCIATHRNRRNKMEDRHTVIPTLSAVEPALTEDLGEDAFFAVFDGHGGPECAAYAASHFYRCVIDVLKRPNPPEGEQLLRDAFSLCDERLTLRCKKESIKSGATAVCVYVKDKTLTCGWVGDSSIGLMTAASVRTLSTNHTPQDPGEYKRIEDVGGLVVMVQGELRVNGVLNLSRSLGDIQGRPMISQEPGTRSVALSGEEYLLFLACDGIWEALTESQVYECVRKYVQTHPIKEFSHLGEFIAEEAREQGSTDNMTVIAVCLRPVADLWALFN
uniref:PPM-type phosphatase domain-containing protein n=1 Tax=Steinernema glaseri TaxID=37863 RepID=A0A1I8AWS0_9BILA